MFKLSFKKCECCKYRQNYQLNHQVNSLDNQKGGKKNHTLRPICCIYYADSGYVTFTYGYIISLSKGCLCTLELAELAPLFYIS